MYKMVEWNETLDLEEFYQEAERRGHRNNANQKSMIDCFKNEDKWNAWILYKDDKAIGSVVAHSFPEMNGYRILARTCVLDGVRNSKGLGTGRRYIVEHQNLTSQYFVPTCIEWCGVDSDMYVTSNNEEAGSQRLVNKIYFPLLEKQGEFKKVKEINYRNTEQIVWKLNAHKFLENLRKYPCIK